MPPPTLCRACGRRPPVPHYLGLCKRCLAVPALVERFRRSPVRDPDPHPLALPARLWAASPTTAMPGTLEKIHVLSWRADAEVPLFNRLDERGDGADAAAGELASRLVREELRRRAALVG